MLVTTSPNQFCYDAPLYFIFRLEMIVQKVLIQKKKSIDSMVSKSWDVQYSDAIPFLLSQFSAKTKIILYFI